MVMIAGGQGAGEWGRREGSQQGVLKLESGCVHYPGCGNGFLGVDYICQNLKCPSMCGLVYVNHTSIKLFFL